MTNKVTLPCGCEHNEKIWTQLCIQHKKEFDMRHAAATVTTWASDRRDQNLDLVS